MQAKSGQQYQAHHSQDLPIILQGKQRLEKGIKGFI
jgi:hypothetical protein